MGAQRDRCLAGDRPRLDCGLHVGFAIQDRTLPAARLVSDHTGLPDAPPASAESPLASTSCLSSPR
jgi:hypothetical protein